MNDALPAIRKRIRHIAICRGCASFWGGVVLLQMTCAVGAFAGGQTLSENHTKKGISLFHSMEFRGSLKVLTKWTRILDLASAQVHELNTCDFPSGQCPPGTANWRELLSEARKRSGSEQLKYVNGYLNRWPYRLDLDVYGIRDYWATPGEFLQRSGDCEDYCITKYYALKELGYSPDRLRIVIIRDEIRNIAHATLAVYLDQKAYILDNLSDAVFDQGRYRHYVPQYSFNEFHRWAHIPLREQPENQWKGEAPR